ncbi:syntaxin-1A-like isoform X2 [Lycorma delicatula]|uniref:syntaxin-1A-like isoform X2 n=1 Tax=Lycorma delicatula TaxID=130591 RepID=UPI003F50E179
MTKDRLNELQTAQNDESSTLLENNGNDGHLKIEIASNISRYKVSKKPKEIKNNGPENKELDIVYNKVKEIKEWLEQIEDETISLRKIQGTVLQSVFNSNSHSKLEESMSLIKSTSLKARGGLRELDNIKSDAANKNGPNHRLIFRVISTQQSVLQKQYVNAMTQYQNALVTHKEKTEQLIRDQLQIVISSITRRTLACVPVDRDITNEELEAMLDKQNTSIFVGNYLQETMEARQKLQDARQRHKELLQIEMAITELHDMFIEMATLVENQGEVIDRIENYVSRGADLVENGTSEIGKAKENKNRARKAIQSCTLSGWSQFSCMISKEN